MTRHQLAGLCVVLLFVTAMAVLYAAVAASTARSYREQLRALRRRQNVVRVHFRVDAAPAIATLNAAARRAAERRHPSGGQR